MIDNIDIGSSPVGVSSRSEKISSRLVQRHVSLEVRLTTKIIAAVIVATIGLVLLFVGSFRVPDVPDSKVGHHNTASCIKIRNMIISFVNSIPEAVDRVRVGVEVRAVGQEYTYWLAVMLILTDGSVRTEKRKIEEIPGVVVFPLDFLSVEAKRHNLMVDVDIVDAADVPAGACSRSIRGHTRSRGQGALAPSRERRRQAP